MVVNLKRKHLLIYTNSNTNSRNTKVASTLTKLDIKRNLIFKLRCFIEKAHDKIISISSLDLKKEKINYNKINFYIK